MRKKIHYPPQTYLSLTLKITPNNSIAPECACACIPCLHPLLSPSVLITYVRLFILCLLTFASMLHVIVLSAD